MRVQRPYANGLLQVQFVLGCRFSSQGSLELLSLNVERFVAFGLRARLVHASGLSLTIGG